MRFLDAVFIGYIGFKNGMGLDKVHIDFTKCKNNIVLISGKNGSGKSTLLSSLNIFPDPSICFTPGIDARKEFIIQDQDIIYNIQIISQADNSGGRKTTKAFIQKNGIELNTNGNISSYKDIIDNEFELDSNYLTLSHLSNDGNKGLGSLTPAERKRFTSNIMENLEVYNEMYKTLSKKSNVYKSYIGNLHSKIQNIGSKDLIESNLKQLRSKEHDISVKIMELNNTIVTIQAKCTVDESEAKKVEDLNNQVSTIQDKLSNITNSVNQWFNRTKIYPENIEDTYDNDSNILNEYKTSLETSKSDFINLSNSLESTTNNIRSIEAEFEIYQEDSNIEAQYKESERKINELLDSLSKYGISPESKLVIPLTNLLSTFKDIITYIDSLYSDIEQDDLVNICLNYNASAVEEYQTELQNLFMQINEIDGKIRDVRERLKQVTILRARPKKCEIDNCPFIKEAVEISKVNGIKELENEFGKLQRELDKASKRVTKVNELIEISRIRDSKRSILDRILDLIDSKSELLTTFGVSILIDREVFLKTLSRRNSFNDLRDPKMYREILNDLIIYESEYNVYEKLSIQYDTYKDKMRLLESNNKVLVNLKVQEADLLEKVNIAQNNLTKYTNLVTEFSNKVNDEQLYKEDYLTKKQLESDFNRVKDQLDEYTRKAGKSIELLNSIKGYKDQIETLTQSTKPITDEISRLTGELTLLDSYYKEYNEYKAQYDLIETVKKYCSPTNGGIQVLFMQIYMNQTLELSNQILSLLFNNEYRLLDFVINSNEFRIPFIGNGLPVDDISNGSSSQVCMMSMIINLVLLHQGSSKFNIARLDEIDDSLDSYNRSNFVNVLYRILPLLNIEQLFIISHSIELDSSMADVIKLMSYEEYDSIQSTNVIWDYKNEI